MDFESDPLSSDPPSEIQSSMGLASGSPLWAMMVIFLQLCVFIGLAFLFYKTATSETLKAGFILAKRLFIVPLCLSCIYPSIRLNQTFLIKNPKCHPYAWGYYNSLLVITIGVSGIALGIWADLGDGANLIIWSILLIVLGTLLYMRNRWVWIVFTILNLNPASWIINGIYLKNRWQEMKGQHNN